MSTKAISVLLPVRDGLPTLDRALESVLASRGVDLELLCVDDGSRDGSGELLEGWARRDERIRVLRTPPRGIVAALNLGLAAARAPLVARMDADDEMHPQRLASQFERLAAEPALALVGCQVESFREGGLQNGYALYTEWVNGITSAEQIARECFVECPVPHPTWMFRREVVCRLGGYADEPWPEDLDLLYRLMAAGHGVGKVPEKLYRWRDHEARLSRSDPRYRKEAFARAKAHYLARLHPLEGAVVWGAGRTGRRFASLLSEEGVATRAFIDINPARTGSSWRGIPILAPACVPVAASEWRDEGLLVLGAVSSRGARAQIRGALVDAGLEEGHDFLMVA